jgi:hypothetical protein
MDDGQDPDINSDKDLKKDTDLSMNYKTIGGSVNLMSVVRLAKTPKTKVRRKEDGKIVEVSRDTLKERGGEYEKYETETSDDLADVVQEIANRIKSDPGLASRLRNLLDPSSDLGGLAKGNPSYPASTFEKNLPPSIKTLGDLLTVAEKAFATKGKKPKTPPQNSPSKEESAPEKVPEPKPETTETDNSKNPEPKPPVEEPPTETTEAPKEDKSKGKPKKPESKPKPPTRRVPSNSEVEESRMLVVSTFPPKLAGMYIRMHPDDIRSLVSSFNEFKSLGPIKSGDIESELAKIGKVTLDPDKIPPPKKVTWEGKEVDLSTLSPEDQVEETQRHRTAVVGAQLALRSRAILSMKKAGTPPKMAQKLTDFMLSTNGLSPEDKMKKAREKSRDLFVTASSDSSLLGRDERFGVPKTQGNKERPSLGEARKKTLSTIKDPAAQTLMVAAFQGEDYRQAVAEHFGSRSKKAITSEDSVPEIVDKIKNVESFFKERAKGYPEDLKSGLDDPASLFRVRVRQAVLDMDPKKAKKLSKALAQIEADSYDDSMSDYVKNLKEYRERLREWMQSGTEEDAPVEPKKPSKPASYDSVRGTKDPIGLQSKMDKLLGVGKTAYSSYSDKLLIARYTENWSPPKEENMTIKFAKEDADRILVRLEKMASYIQDHHASWDMDFNSAKALVNDLDRTADEVEKAAFGEESFQTRQIEVLKAAKVIQQDSDESYMGTFNAPMAPKQTDSDEGYMSQFRDDQSQAVATGKSSTGRPLAP